MGAISQSLREALDLAKTALSTPDDNLRKSITQSTGLLAYNLEAPSKKLFPVITPLRNAIPRQTGGRGNAINWKAVLGINTTSLASGVSEGNRGGVVSTNVASFVAAYKGLGLEDNVSFEADYGGRTFEDVKALAVTNLLKALMIQEEKCILGGNGGALGNTLGVTPTPTVATSTTGGAIATSTVCSVICVALTLDGVTNTTQATGVPAQITRTNADGTVDTYGGGSAQKSVAANVTTGAGATNSVTGSVVPVVGALGYAWFLGTVGAERFAVVTTINSVLLTVVPTTTQLASALPAQDSSKNALLFDGIIPQTIGAGAPSAYLVGQGGASLAVGSTGALIGTMSTGAAGTGTPLTADNKGGVVEIDAVLRAMWDLYRLSPSILWVNSQEAQNIMIKVMTATSVGATRFVDAAQGAIAGGYAVRSYLNKFTMDGAAILQIRIHPNLPPGTMVFQTEELPYPMSNVPSVLQMDVRQEYYQLEWQLRTRKYEYGVYCDEVLKHYFPSAFAILTNIGNG
jgi:hypothetical protein